MVCLGALLISVNGSNLISVENETHCAQEREREKERRNSHGAVNFSFSDTYGLLRQEALCYILLLHPLSQQLFYIFEFFFLLGFCMVIVLVDESVAELRFVEFWKHGEFEEKKRFEDSIDVCNCRCFYSRVFPHSKKVRGFCLPGSFRNFFCLEFFEGFWWIVMNNIKLNSCFFPSCFCCVRFGILRRTKRGLSMIAV